MPLKSASRPMRSTSDASWLTSDWIATLSVVESVPFEYSTASSRTRWSMAWTSLSEPSAVCVSEIASDALRWAWSRPLICAFSFSLMAMPAASSAAELMRRPEERRWIDFDSMSLVRLSCRWALNASMLVLMRRDTDHLLDDVDSCPGATPCRPLCCARGNRPAPGQLEELFQAAAAGFV